METTKLNALLVALGWEPIDGTKSVTYRFWKLVGDERPDRPVIRVPRTHFVPRSQARRILRRATTVALR